MDRVVKITDIIRVTLPLSFPLPIVYAYVFRDTAGITVLDTGVYSKESRMVWEQIREQGSWRWQDVRQIVLTHHHADHCGLAGWMQQQSGAPVLMSAEARVRWEQFVRTSSQPDGLDWCRHHRIPAAGMRKIDSYMQRSRCFMDPLPTVFGSPLTQGMMQQLGSRSYQVISTPGHAEGHVSFWEPEQQFLLGGDVLLGKIPPHVGYLPGGDPNPLATYFVTLNRLAALPIAEIWPAHGFVFSCVTERIAAARTYYEHHFVNIAQQLRTRGPLGVYELCEGRWPKFAKRPAAHFSLSITEMLACLVYLQQAGQVTRQQDGRYRNKSEDGIGEAGAE